jgi:hypothetical protein
VSYDPVREDMGQLRPLRHRLLKHTANLLCAIVIHCIPILFPRHISLDCSQEGSFLFWRQVQNLTNGVSEVILF